MGRSNADQGQLLFPGLSSSANIRDRFEIGRELGRGGGGVVHACHSLVSGRPIAACKSIPKYKLQRREVLMELKNEVDTMLKLRGHPHIVELQGLYEDSGAVHLIMDLCEGGDLYEYLATHVTLPEKVAAMVVRQILLALRHCHENGVVHRDVKPENILITKPLPSEPPSGTGPLPQMQLKLADFGLAMRLKPGEKAMGMYGSSVYMAPEVVCRRGCSMPVDIWSLGVILYTALCGYMPFWGSTEEDLFLRILRNNPDFEVSPWPTVSQPAVDLVRWMLSTDPAARPSSLEALNHPWVVQNTADLRGEEGKPGVPRSLAPAPAAKESAASSWMLGKKSAPAASSTSTVTSVEERGEVAGVPAKRSRSDKQAKKDEASVASSMEVDSSGEAKGKGAEGSAGTANSKSRESSTSMIGGSSSSSSSSASGGAQKRQKDAKVDPVSETGAGADAGTANATAAVAPSPRGKWKDRMREAFSPRSSFKERSPSSSSKQETSGDVVSIVETENGLALDTPVSSYERSPGGRRKIPGLSVHSASPSPTKGSKSSPMSPCLPLGVEASRSKEEKLAKAASTDVGGTEPGKKIEEEAGRGEVQPEVRPVSVDGGAGSVAVADAKAALATAAAAKAAKARDWPELKGVEQGDGDTAATDAPESADLGLNGETLTPKKHKDSAAAVGTEGGWGVSLLSRGSSPVLSPAKPAAKSEPIRAPDLDVEEQRVTKPEEAAPGAVGVAPAAVAALLSESGKQVSGELKDTTAAGEVSPDVALSATQSEGSRGSKKDSPKVPPLAAQVLSTGSDAKTPDKTSPSLLLRTGSFNRLASFGRTGSAKAKHQQEQQQHEKRLEKQQAQQEQPKLPADKASEQRQPSQAEQKQQDEQQAQTDDEDPQPLKRQVRPAPPRSRSPFLFLRLSTYGRRTARRPYQQEQLVQGSGGQRESAPSSGRPGPLDAPSPAPSSSPPMAPSIPSRRFASPQRSRASMSPMRWMSSSRPGNKAEPRSSLPLNSSPPKRYSTPVGLSRSVAGTLLPVERSTSSQSTAGMSDDASYGTPRRMLSFNNNNSGKSAVPRSQSSETVFPQVKRREESSGRAASPLAKPFMSPLRRRQTTPYAERSIPPVAASSSSMKDTVQSDRKDPPTLLSMFSGRRSAGGGGFSGPAMSFSRGDKTGELKQSGSSDGKGNGKGQKAVPRSKSVDRMRWVPNGGVTEKPFLPGKHHQSPGGGKEGGPAASVSRKDSAGGELESPSSSFRLSPPGHMSDGVASSKTSVAPSPLFLTGSSISGGKGKQPEVKRSSSRGKGLGMNLNVLRGKSVSEPLNRSGTAGNQASPAASAESVPSSEENGVRTVGPPAREHNLRPQKAGAQKGGSTKDLGAAEKGSAGAGVQSNEDFVSRWKAAQEEERDATRASGNSTDLGMPDGKAAGGPWPDIVDGKTAQALSPSKAEAFVGRSRWTRTGKAEANVDSSGAGQQTAGSRTAAVLDSKGARGLSTGARAKEATPVQGRSAQNAGRDESEIQVFDPSASEQLPQRVGSGKDDEDSTPLEPRRARSKGSGLMQGMPLMSPFRPTMSRNMSKSSSFNPGGAKLAGQNASSAPGKPARQGSPLRERIMRFASPGRLRNSSSNAPALPTKGKTLR